ncbi:MAG: PilN domain-containing protein [Thermodesulfobacteriota bacterium]|nr:PilN domain-containing protein [Thermodesulfobacteriota bacterium]
MIKINLLPYRAARRKENIRQQISIFLLFFIFVFSGLVYYHIRLGGKVNAAKERLATTQEELKSYNKKVAEVDALKKKLTLLDQKLEVMTKLNMDRKEPVNMLAAISGQAIRGRMWITNLRDNGADVSIKGIAMDNKTVAMFMTRLEASGFFGSADLENIVHEDRGGMSLKRFDLRCLKSS